MKNHRVVTLEALERFIIENKNNIESVLELGCGAVNFKEYFEKNGIGWMGMDLQPIPQQNIMVGDFNFIPYPDKSFDLIFSCHSFEHTINPIRSLQEMKRVAKKYIFLSTPYHCVHQILNADLDHLFCFTDIQMERLFRFCGIIKKDIFVEKEPDQADQFWCLISIGET